MSLIINLSIFQVNSKMLDTLISTESDILVFIYRQNNLNDQNIVDELEHIDDELEEKGIELVKCSDKGVEREYGFSHVPLLIYFQNEIPNAYDGELDDENEVLKWLFDTMAKSEIEEVTGPVLDVLIERLDNLAVIFFDNEGSILKFIHSLYLSKILFSRIALIFIRLYLISRNGRRR